MELLSIMDACCYPQPSWPIRRHDEATYWIYSNPYVLVTKNVTGFTKTDHNVTRTGIQIMP